METISHGSFKNELQYINLGKSILEKGKEKTDRTGVGTISTFGEQVTFDLQAGFPIATTKFVPFRLILSELLWFLRGDSNIKFLLENNNHIWDEWPFKKWVESDEYNGPDMTDFGKRASTDEEFNKIYQEQKKIFVDKILTDDDFANKFGELGHVYGAQWRKWQTRRGKTIDQIKDVINQIKTNPDSRRMIVTAWNPEDLPEMLLPPCHLLMQFYVNNGELSCQFYQRSMDFFLGEFFDIPSYAILTHIIARECGLKVGKLVQSIGDAHIYKNHMEQVKTLLSREMHEEPKLIFPNGTKPINEYTIEDIKLDNYKHEPGIKAPVAV